DRPARRRHRGKPCPRADRDRRPLGLHRRDILARRPRARAGRCRHRHRCCKLACAMAQDNNEGRERGDTGAANQQLDAAGRTHRPAQRASRPSPQRIAIDATHLSGGDMVTATLSDVDLGQRAWEIAARVVDPEIPVLTIADLGVLREVAVHDGRVEVAITPTYSGCPAMNVIALEIELALERAGFARSTVRTVLSPAWTTDWMSEDGRNKLRAYGIAPPQALK